MRLIHSWQKRSGGIVHANGVVQTTGLLVVTLFLVLWSVFESYCKVESVAGKVAKNSGANCNNK
jgi:hypothetical protein